MPYFRRSRRPGPDFHLGREGQPIPETAKANPFSGLSSYIPTNTCGSYSTATGSSIPAKNIINFASVSATAVKSCGNAKLGANVTVTAANAELVVYSGSLDLNGHTLSTSGSGSLTIIFSGVNEPSGAGPSISTR